MEAAQNKTQRGVEGEEMEEEVEQFFALIQRLRDSRAVLDRIRARDDRKEEEEVEEEGGGEGGRKRRRRTENKSSSSGSWVPKFEWEDFHTEVAFAASNKSSGSSAPVSNGGEVDQRRNKKTTEEDESKSKLLDPLDLKLTL